MKKRRLLYLTPAMLLASLAHGQSIGPSQLNAAGGSATISSETYEYAIGGSPVATSYGNASLVVIPGPLQPVQPTAVPDVTPGLSGLSVYPNPAVTVLHIAPSFGHAGVMEMILTDAAGKSVLRKSSELRTGAETQTLNMEGLAASTYFLTVQWYPQSGTGTPGALAGASAYTIQKLR